MKNKQNIGKYRIFGIFWKIEKLKKLIKINVFGRSSLSQALGLAPLIIFHWLKPNFDGFKSDFDQKTYFEKINNNNHDDDPFWCSGGPKWTNLPLYWPSRTKFNEMPTTFITGVAKCFIIWVVKWFNYMEWPRIICNWKRGKPPFWIDTGFGHSIYFHVLAIPKNKIIWQPI